MRLFLMLVLILGFSLSGYSETFHVGNKSYPVTVLTEENFSNLKDWVREGPGTASVKNNTLVWDALDSFGTLWNKTLVDGPSILEYEVRTEGEKNNINAFFYGSIMKNGRETLFETSSSRDGSYQQYHQFQNYIMTYLTTKPRTDWRIRFRKDPGFNLVEEKNFVRRIPSSQYQHLVHIFEKDGTMSLWIDGKLELEFKDTSSPYRKGFHALRTYRTKSVYKNLKMYKIVEPGNQVGDLDQNGKISLTDIRILIRMLTGRVPSDLRLGDVNQDGSLDLKDVIAEIKLVINS